MGAPDWTDPHGVIPETFRERYGDLETVADALRRAEARPSSTADDERSCCPECYSVAITPKSESVYSQPLRKGDWECNECHTHFDEPLDMNPNATTFDWIESDELADPDEQGELEGPLTDLGREQAVRYAILLRAPWDDADTLSYSEIATALPFGRSWVGERNREWRDGEHRELVPDPPAEPEPAPSNEPPIDPSVAVAQIGGDYDELVAERVESNDASSDAAAVADGGRPPRRWAAYGSD